MITPTTPSGLSAMDRLAPGPAILRAWTVTGPRASWHRAAQRVVRGSMPGLAAALERGDTDAAVREWHRRGPLVPIRRHRVRDAMPVLARALDRA